MPSLYYLSNYQGNIFKKVFSKYIFHQHRINRDKIIRGKVKSKLKEVNGLRKHDGEGIPLCHYLQTLIYSDGDPFLFLKKTDPYPYPYFLRT